MHTPYNKWKYTIVLFVIMFTLPMAAKAVSATPSTSGSEYLLELSDTTILVCVSAAYFILLMLARYLWIVLPNNYYLQAYVDEIMAQIVVEQDRPDKKSNIEHVVLPEIRRSLKEVHKLIPCKLQCLYWVFVGSGKQLAGWRKVHDAKRLATDLLSPSDAYTSAIVAGEKLKQLKTPAAKILTEKIEVTIKGDKLDYTLIKSLTKQADELLFDARDSYFETLSDWQNKSTWLVMTALLIVLVLGVSIGNVKLFALGAVGGLLSRMSKVFTRRDLGFDYGVSWSTLFMAPLLGALTGWAGVLLVVVLLDIGVLGEMFDKLEDLKWVCADSTQVTMALAVVFGFSASIFDRMMERMEGTLAKGPTVASSSSISNEEGS